MKILPLRLAALVLWSTFATTSFAQFASEAAPALDTSLAAQLPADTLVYFEIPNFTSLRQGIGLSSLGQMYEDPELQDFLAESLGVLEGKWETIRAMSAGMGIPKELTFWEALQSLEFGFALRSDPAVENPLSAPPQIYSQLRLGLGEGLGEPVFSLLTKYGEELGLELLGSEEGDFLALNLEEGSVEITLQGDALLATFLMGAKGEGSLALNPHFLQARSRTFSDGAVVYGFMQWNSILETVLKAISFENPPLYGPVSRLYERLFKPIESLAFSSGWTSEGSFSNFRLGMNGDGGGLYAPIPLNLDLLKYVPSDATGFSLKSAAPEAGTFLLETLDDFGGVNMGSEELPIILKDGLAEAAPEIYAWLFGDKRSELEAALAGFGAQGFGYNTTVGITSENINYFELTDGPAVSNMLTQLLPRLRNYLDEQEFPIRLEMKRVKLRVKQDDGSVVNKPGPAYYMLDFAALDEVPPQISGLVGNLQPTFGISEDGWLVASSSKQPVRRILMHGLEVPEENIRSNTDASSFLAKVDEHISALAWSDPRPAVDAAAGMALGFMPMVLNLAGNEADLPFDVDKLPTAELFTRYLQPTESLVRIGEGESMIRSIGSFGVADMFSLVGAVTAVGPPVAMLLMSNEQAPPMLIAPPPPPPPSEEEF